MITYGDESVCRKRKDGHQIVGLPAILELIV